ncbi:pseudouridine synthase [Rhodobacter sp. SGA-6-6]|uniref:pseudouridine synthase n=1 Tax=Rhodobacter sp. SGA-6-6 TaxID=2710882 RepID=UPI0013E9AEA9|nr:pseudouridine synthase [Rhodobacter sp. SGA-6-6]NGM45285.1 pseudouridine synthase [Rhodobacter sp. SGA-6-6]
MADKATPEGERIAKVLSRRGIASRREAERLIEAGEVTVNGKVIASPALNVTEKDRITVSGKPLPEEEPARLWLYYKPEGLVTSAADEKGRDTVFDHLPGDMPRVMSVGRLDLNSEGLLLLTNDGELKRRLELPSTGWLRKYRVRVNGNPTDDQLEPLRKGITIEGERFQPMQVTLDRIQGANAWLTVGLREGRNREIRRAMNAIDLYVNRLIRVSYGPFRLNDMRPGEVEEVRPKVLREQLGAMAGDDAAPARPARKPASQAAKPAGKAGAKPARATAGKTALPRTARSGDGVKALARAWKEAVTPDPGGKPTRPATGKAGAKPAPKPTAKPAARGEAKPPPKRSAAPSGRSGPAKPRGPGRDAPRPRRGT